MISRARPAVRRLGAAMAEVGYAQRRMFEIRTGLPLTPESERALARAEILRLEALYALTLRLATSEDDQALAELAELDEAPPLTGPVLLAEIDDSLRAAISLADLRTIADPFEPTAALVQLLRIRGRQLQGTPQRSRSLGRLTRLARLARLRAPLSS